MPVEVVRCVESRSEVKVGDVEQPGMCSVKQALGVTVWVTASYGVIRIIKEATSIVLHYFTPTLH